MADAEFYQVLTPAQRDKFMTHENEHPGHFNFGESYNPPTQ